jgi:hypothetical protein
MVRIEEKTASDAGARVGSHGGGKSVACEAGKAMRVLKGEPFSIRVSVTPGAKWVDDAGCDVSWVRVYFIPDSGGAAYEVGNFELAGGAGESPVTTGQSVVFGMRILDHGELLVMTYSLVEGLVLNSRRFEVHD